MKNVLYIPAKAGQVIEVDLYAGAYSDLNPFGVTIDGDPVMKASRTKEEAEKKFTPYGEWKIFKVTLTATVEET